MDTFTTHLEQLRKNWFIILFIAGIIVGWTNFQNRIDQTDKDNVNLGIRLSAVEVKSDTNQSQISSTAGDIKEINAKLTFIQDRLK